MASSATENGFEHAGRDAHMYVELASRQQGGTDLAPVWATSAQGTGRSRVSPASVATCHRLTGHVENHLDKGAASRAR